MKRGAKHKEPVGGLGEEEVVRRLVSQLSQGGRIVVGPGDDCAVVDAGGEELPLLKTDAVVEGIHFLPETEPSRVGWKAVARVVSDFAAMGGGGGELLITIALPESCEMAWLETLYEGMARCAESYGCALVGGETVSLPAGAPAMISIAGTGRVLRKGYATRRAGRPGEGLWVTGVLGGSFASGHHLDFRPRMAEGQWLTRNAGVGAMMDLSDGLRRDLPRLATASECGFRLDETVLPCREGCGVEEALGDGEDMELLFSAIGGDWETKFREQFPETRLTRIGEFVSDGQDSLGEGGWQHFQNREKR
jgi:thiamine-monophosphate kinase